MTEISRAFSRPGPYATVYLDATKATESGAHEVELRWRSLRASLGEQGADDADLVALDDAVNGIRDAGSSGVVLVAGGGEVVFHDRLPRPPLRELAHVAPLPMLMPYFAQRGSRTPYLAVAVDREGAEIVPPPWVAEGPTEVSGAQWPVHKTGRNTWDELHFQRRVENAWEANARDVADAIVKIAAAQAVELVVITGDPRARALLMEQLQSGLREGTEVVSADAGGREGGPGSEEHEEAIRDAVLRHDWRARRELLEHLQQNLGRERYAVAGVRQVVDALRSAAVDTLVVSDDPSSTLHAFVGPEPVHIGLTAEELHDMGVPDPRRDRLDSALVRAVFGTGAHLVVTPNAHDYVPDGVAALLRFDEGM